MAKHILIFEDDIDFARPLIGALYAAGYEPVHQLHPDAGVVDMVRFQNPSLISFDVQMPVMDGFLAAVRVHTDPQTSHIPFIFLTSRGDSEDREHGHRLGAAAYLVKSEVGPATVIAVIHSIVGR
ncbi:MAG: response regulator [Candidatus Kerfeldbacteria bacterium]|nr:response regulator [Candidatus Kerfeldbacteria bacterium]